MKQKIMIIAPGEPVDRNWVPEGAGGAWRWTPPTPIMWSFDYPGMDPMLEDPVRTREAVIRRWIGPGWAVTIPFYVDTRLARPPNGYVMPGSVVGKRLESCNLADRERAIYDAVIALEQAGPDA